MTDIPKTARITRQRLLVEAGDLLSDHGDDPVHDAAIVALVARLLGDDDHAAVSTLIIQTYSRYVPTPPAVPGDGYCQDEPERNEVCDNCGGPDITVRNHRGRFCDVECFNAYTLGAADLPDLDA